MTDDTSRTRELPRLRIEMAGASHAGKRDDHNEDAFAVRPARRFAVLADGMGGHAGGEVASRIVVDTVVEALLDGRTPTEGLARAHRRIREFAQAHGYDRMGSTAIVVRVAHDTANIHWIGDSRVYLWRRDKLRQLTRDHSLVEGLKAAGVLDEQEARQHPNRHVLTRALGVQNEAEPQADSVNQSLLPGDRLLLCSDGLSGYLPAGEMIACLQRGGTAGDIAHRLIDQTLRQTDAADNLTVVCIAAER